MYVGGHDVKRLFILNSPWREAVVVQCSVAVSSLFGSSPIAFRVGLHPTAAILVAAWGVAVATTKWTCSCDAGELRV
ncbi:unnamed protein product [Parnassius apollo]|uniref:(apollo) hypothetical protein n=1 Tax=Parnassius apollo TaxID=110799 RepID=A0A8S3WCW6_PARAO|nr:unnamed protein product [Parnassius apollo]